MGRNNVMKSLAFKYSERLLYQGVGFAVQIVLARLLTPDDYGILTMITVFITISQVFVQGGLNTALIQDKGVSENDYSSIFWVSLSVAIILYMLLFLIAPLIAGFYKMPLLVKVLRVLALVLIPGAFNSIQNAKIIREMKFKELMYCSFFTAVTSGVIGITLAYFGFGVWALVVQQLSNQIIACILMLFVVKWRLRLVFEISRLKVLLSFGWKMLCASLMNTANKEIQNFVIGKKYDSSILGYYSRGKQFPQLVIDNLNGSIQSVMLPVLSKEQDDKARMKAVMRRSMVTSSFIIFPMMTGLAMVAKPLVLLLLTEKWLPCVPYLRIFCFIYAFYPIHTANVQAMSAQGRSDLLLKLQIIKDTIGLLILFVTVLCFDSPVAIAVGVAASTLVVCFVNSFPNSRLLGYSYREQLFDIIPSFILALVMGVMIYPVQLLRIPDIVMILIQFIVGVCVYIAMAWLFKLECFLYLKNSLSNTLKNRKTGGVTY